MLISEVINNIKAYCKGEWNGIKIDENNTRDKILYGNPDQECTGIVTTIYASVDVIKKAHELNANLIICHEALFYNHGDHQDWLKENNNQTYLAKSQLLDEYGIVVWRFHDYIHSGVPINNGEYVDGIFYGLAKITGFDNFTLNRDLGSCLFINCKETSAREIANLIKDKWHLKGLKCIGNLDIKVTKIMVCGHILEGQDIKPLINKINDENINLLLPLELIDFTLTEYIKDSGQLGDDKVILAAGHFNLEEPGMEYLLTYIDDAIGQHIDTHFIQAGDMYTYI